VGAELPLFDGGRTWNAFRQARTARARSLSALQQAADDKAIAVMACFVEAVYNQQTIALAERKLAQSQALLLKTRRQFELGQKSRPDVAQVESQVADDDYNLLRQHNQAQLSLLALKAAMNYPVTDTLLLDTAVAVRHASPVHAETLYDGFGATAPQGRPHATTSRRRVSAIAYNEPPCCPR
jgi:outer membrane protein